MRETIVSSFDKHWQETEGPLSTPCWIWQRGCTKGGYGVLWVYKKQKYAHRYSFERKYGILPAGAVLRHNCDTPACVNPEHLSSGTHQDNVADRVQKNRTAYGERHYLSKLLDSEIIDIRADSRSHRKIASVYGISAAHVSNLKNKKRRAGAK